MNGRYHRPSLAQKRRIHKDDKLNAGETLQLYTIAYFADGEPKIRSPPALSLRKSPRSHSFNSIDYLNSNATMTAGEMCGRREAGLSTLYNDRQLTRGRAPTASLISRDKLWFLIRRKAEEAQAPFFPRGNPPRPDLVDHPKPNQVSVFPVTLCRVKWYI